MNSDPHHWKHLEIAHLEVVQQQSSPLMAREINPAVLHNMCKLVQNLLQTKYLSSHRERAVLSFYRLFPGRILDCCQLLLLCTARSRIFFARQSFQSRFEVRSSTMNQFSQHSLSPSVS